MNWRFWMLLLGVACWGCQSVWALQLAIDIGGSTMWLSVLACLLVMGNIIDTTVRFSRYHREYD